MNAFDTHVILPVARKRATPDDKNFLRGYAIALERRGHYTPSDIAEFLQRNEGSHDAYERGFCAGLRNDVI